MINQDSSIAIYYRDEDVLGETFIVLLHRFIRFLNKSLSI